MTCIEEERVVAQLHDDRAFLRVKISSGHSSLTSVISSFEFESSWSVRDSSSEPDDIEPVEVWPTADFEVTTAAAEVEVVDLRSRLHGRVSFITEWWTTKDPRLGNDLAEPWKQTKGIVILGSQKGELTLNMWQFLRIKLSPGLLTYDQISNQILEKY